MGTTKKWPRPTGANTYVLFTVSLCLMVVNMGPPQYHHLTIGNILRQQPTIWTQYPPPPLPPDPSPSYPPPCPSSTGPGKPTIKKRASVVKSKILQSSFIIMLFNLFIGDYSIVNSGHDHFYNISPFVRDVEFRGSSDFELIPITFGFCNEVLEDVDDNFDVLLQATPPPFGLKGYTGEGPDPSDPALIITRVRPTSPDSQAQFKKNHGSQMTSIIAAIVSKTPLDNISSEQLVNIHTTRAPTFISSRA